MALSTQNDEIQETADADADAAFKRFDNVSDYSDHYFANLRTNSITRKLSQKINEEWKLLSDHLPDSIYVRAYDTRFDLLRAVIVGVTGTPYHDGLFFFDIHFAPDYPARPPQVHYRSYGLRLNPNLYANGRVCLSLLNTWPGKKREKWDQAQSTVLQVLLSIQALVLNERPYFNEPGHGNGMLGRATWEKKSQAYNEDVFVLACKTTLFVLRRPPRNFEAFTAEHFRQRASVILRACGEYANGRMGVGYYRDGGEDDESVESCWVSVTEVSRKFKASMELLYPQLFAAFKRNGASLGSLVDHLDLLEKTRTTTTTPFKARGDKKAAYNYETAKKVIAKLKKVLGSTKQKKNATATKTQCCVGVADAADQ